jgi:hypothetical protein
LVILHGVGSPSPKAPHVSVRKRGSAVENSLFRPKSRSLKRTPLNGETFFSIILMASTCLKSLPLNGFPGSGTQSTQNAVSRRRKINLSKPEQSCHKPPYPSEK